MVDVPRHLKAYVAGQRHAWNALHGDGAPEVLEWLRGCPDLAKHIACRLRFRSEVSPEEDAKRGLRYEEDRKMLQAFDMGDSISGAMCGLKLAKDDFG